MEGNWVSMWNWMLHDPKTGRRGTSTGSGGGGYALFCSLYWRKMDVSFRPGVREGLPDLRPHESLRLVQIEPRYMGSAEVEVVVEDFVLVPERNIEMAEKK